MFPAFRQLGNSNITLDKSGNATLKHQTQLWLLEATQDYTSSMLTQIEELKSFIAQASTLSGKGLSSVTYDTMDRGTLNHATKSYAAEFANKRKSIEGTSVNKKKLQKVRAKDYRNIHVDLGRQLQKAKSVIAEENAEVPIEWSPPCRQEPPEENFSEIVPLASLGVRKCYRCKGGI